MRVALSPMPQSEMQLRVLPVLPLTFAFRCRAVKTEFALGTESQTDVMTGEQMLTFGTEAHLSK